MILNKGMVSIAESYWPIGVFGQVSFDVSCMLIGA